MIPPRVRLATASRASTTPAGGDAFAAAFGAVILRAIDAGDCGMSSLAARWGVPEETLRGWRDGRGGPTFDRLLRIARRMTDRELLDALRSIGGVRVLVAIVVRDELPERVRPAAVMQEAIRGLHEFTALIEEISRRSADGVICRDDAATLALLWSAARGAGDRAILTAERCAGL